MTLSTTQIEEERRRGRVAAAATIAAGVLLGVGVVWSTRVNSDRPDSGDAARLRFFDDHAGELIGVSVVRGLGFGLLIFTILHLYRATKGRNPELPSVQLVVGLFGAVALAVGGLIQAVALADKAADFASQTFPTVSAANKAAEDVATEPLPLAAGIIAFAGTIGLAFWFVMGSLNAMRVGLLTRFMGVLGIIVGPGFLFGFALPVMVLWLIAVGVLFLGRWPSGLPPAWRTGDAVPWPGRDRIAESPAEEPEAAGGSPNGEVDAVGPGVRKPEEPQAPQRRKRKRRS